MEAHRNTSALMRYRIVTPLSPFRVTLTSPCSPTRFFARSPRMATRKSSPPNSPGIGCHALDIASLRPVVGTTGICSPKRSRFQRRQLP